jgi:hemin uptake protein HemP
MTRSSDMQQGQRDRTGHRSGVRPLAGTPVIDSAQLLADRKEVQICHAGEVYRLRVTKNGKLILNK